MTSSLKPFSIFLKKAIGESKRKFHLWNYKAILLLNGWHNASNLFPSLPNSNHQYWKFHLYFHNVSAKKCIFRWICYSNVFKNMRYFLVKIGSTQTLLIDETLQDIKKKYVIIVYLQNLKFCLSLTKKNWWFLSCISSFDLKMEMAPFFFTTDNVGVCASLPFDSKAYVIHKTCFYSRVRHLIAHCTYSYRIQED